MQAFVELLKSLGAARMAAMAAETVTHALVGRTVADVERDLILETLKHCLGNRTHAANILGISIRRCATSSTNSPATAYRSLRRVEAR